MENHFMYWQESMAKPSTVHNLHPTSAAGGETATQRNRRSKYTVASLPEPWLQRLTSLSLDSSLPNAHRQQLLGTGLLSILLGVRTERRRAVPQQTAPPGHHLNQAWCFWWACNSVTQLVIKNDCTFLLSYLKEGWCLLLQSYLQFPYAPGSPSHANRGTESWVGSCCVQKGGHLGRGWSVGFWQYCVTTHILLRPSLEVVCFLSAGLFDGIDPFIETE